MSKKFVVLTSGRAGSTSLMEALAKFTDIALPRHLFSCIDDELLHPQRVRGVAQALEQKMGVSITNSITLIERFFEYSNASAYAGFKSMPERHARLSELISNPDIIIITLIREDVASTVASFQMAMSYGTWRRQGQAPKYRLRYDPAQDHLLEPNIRYVVQSNQQLQSIPAAISLTYEQLCQPDFSNAKLNAFFQRSVSLTEPVKPTQGASYVENWPAFEKLVQRYTRAISND